LFHSILNPIEAHIYGLGSFDFGALVCKSICRGVVCGDGCCLDLGPTFFMQDLSEVYSFLSVVEESSNFQLPRPLS
jgi:hypothetical protein